MKKSEIIKEFVDAHKYSLPPTMPARLVASTARYARSTTVPATSLRLRSRQKIAQAVAPTFLHPAAPDDI